MRTRVSILILNWNRAKDTIECLESVKKLRVSGFKLEIIIVDNASANSSVRKIEKYLKACKKSKSINYEVVVNEKNLGFAAGNNVGIKHALNHGSDYIMLLNNDTLVDKNLLVGLLDIFKKRKRVGAISPKIYFAKGFEYRKGRYKKSELGKVIWYAGGSMDWENILGSNRGVDEVDRNQFKKVEKTDFFTGACVLLSSEAIKDAGMFDEQYFMYLEDVDLAHRMKKAGWKVLFTPKVHLWHKVAQSSKIGSELNDYFITRNRLIFGMRYADLRTRFALYRESLKLLMYGRDWQRKGIIDFYFMRTGRGSWKDK